MKEWKSSGKIEKVFDKSVKGNIFSLESPGASLSFPKTDKSGVCMVQPFLVFQVYLPVGRPLNIEVAITDSKKVRLFSVRGEEGSCSHPVLKNSI